MAKSWLQKLLTNFYIRTLTARTGKLVGTDELGNQYYRAVKPGQWGREPRWVLYAGQDEASMVPAEWHGWLHHRQAEPPTVTPPVHRVWQIPHVPNPTGTEAAYRPPGHTLEGGHRARATGDYQPWTPS
jgi:NADH:ubiquinone oxidoreductase subunit